jgi:DNA-binding transcriptional LysR family regulator
MSLLVAAVDAGSLSAAATRLGLPLATVSRRIAELEERLGSKVVQRSRSGLSLTVPGEGYVTACRSILERVSEAERTVAGEFVSPKGLLTLTAPIVFGRMHVLPIIASFLETCPEVSVRLQQADRTVSLVEEGVDAAIRIGHLPDSSLRARRVGQVTKVVCASPSYLTRRGRPNRLEDLESHDWITFEALMAPDRWQFGEGRNQRHVRSNPRLVVNTAEAAVDAAVAGLGVTRVFSYQVARELEAGRLEIVLRDHEPPPLPVSLLHVGGPIPQKLRSFIDFATPRLEAVLVRAR